MIANPEQTASIIEPTLELDELAEDPFYSLATQSSLAANRAFSPNSIVTHHPSSGLNPIVDAASYLLSVLSKLKVLKAHRTLSQLQRELTQEVNRFQEAIQSKGYSLEYIVVCRFVICATFDDVLSQTPWGSHGQWDEFSLLTAFNQDPDHHEKFFAILDRTVKDPAQYIDLMELLYLSLSFGYKGQYRSEQGQFQLEQISNQLFKHIRAHRGHFSKTLSPAPFKTRPGPVKATRKKTPLWFTMMVTASIIMAIFVSLGYLMDAISNETYQNLAQLEQSSSTNIA